MPDWSATEGPGAGVSSPQAAVQGRPDDARGCQEPFPVSQDMSPVLRERQRRASVPEGSRNSHPRQDRHSDSNCPGGQEEPGTRSLAPDRLLHPTSHLVGLSRAGTGLQRAPGRGLALGFWLACWALPLPDWSGALRRSHIPMAIVPRLAVTEPCCSKTCWRATV